MMHIQGKEAIDELIGQSTKPPMKRIDALQKINKNIRGAIALSDILLSEMTNRQKEQWELLVGTFLKQASKNIEGLKKKAIEKGLNKL